MYLAAGFLLATATMVAAWYGDRALALGLFALALAATLAIYLHHATNTLALSF